MRALILLALFPVFAVAEAGVKPLPDEVKAFIAERNICDHFRSEPYEGSPNRSLQSLGPAASGRPVTFTLGVTNAPNPRETSFLEADSQTSADIFLASWYLAIGQRKDRTKMG